ncbi:Nuclear pore complex protein GP210 [Camellia lanceoleosa]|uniref:Nuclear pore complex protein GP210 n=1 Tax=Camellia lanceoleosa TaxID=1840588 RepID=A0ACC0J4P6_9ERIC|nr:Nuclear pore complex protein GP210 [Camellia lanceoleosa]
MRSKESLQSQSVQVSKSLFSRDDVSHVASSMWGVFSDLYVVKGTGIGHKIVSVDLLEPQFEHMADKIVLSVAEAMSLDPPSPVFVLIGATVRYCLKVIRGNIPQGDALNQRKY